METIPKYDYRVIHEFMISLDCARSLSISLLARYGEWEQIVNLRFNPLDYNDVETARNTLLATDFLRKHENLPTGIDLDAVALAGFYAAESECQLANDRLRERNAHASVLFKAQRKIAAILGSVDIMDILDEAGWGPGSTLRIKRKDASSANKFRKELELTPALLKIFQKPWFQAQFPSWVMNFREYEGNKVITVPKNAKTNRVIAVEPSGNLFFQKGIGAVIRKKLARFGVDLNDQSTNQKLAWVGSKFGCLATVDFSAASDTISNLLVLELLPFEWFQLLELVRSPRGYVEGKLIEYEKFSSMGNGFTFELESLIFYALACAFCDETDPLSLCISVYGDDLILPSKYVPGFRDFCAYVGFTLNMTKSYWDSPYRESCGKHYWDGFDVTPIYLRRNLVDQVEKMHLHNRLVELSMITIGEGFRDKRFRHCIEFLRNGALVTVPYGYGDCGFIVSFDEAYNLTLHKGYMRGYQRYGIFVKPYWREEDDWAFFTAKLFDLAKRKDTSVVCETTYKKNEVSTFSDGQPTGNKVGYSPRRNYIRKKIWFPDWPCLGCYI